MITINNEASYSKLPVHSHIIRYEGFCEATMTIWKLSTTEFILIAFKSGHKTVSSFKVCSCIYTLYEWMSAALHTACTCTLYRAQNCTFHNFLLLNAHRFPHLNGRCCVLSLQLSAVDLVSLPSVTSNFRVSASTNTFVHLIEAKKNMRLHLGWYWTMTVVCLAVRMNYVACSG